jgi:cyanophycinase-like exopeptidase
MKNITILIVILLHITYSFSQTNTLLFEQFEGTSFPPSGWEIIDHDGDSKNWYHRTDSYTGNKLACSRSYESTALTPHNLLITSPIDLTEFSETDRLRLNFKIAATGNNHYQEHYKLVLSTSGNEFEDIEAGEILIEETLTQLESGWNFKTRIINLGDYAGQYFWLAWVHYNCSDQDGLLLDDIHIYEGEDPEELPYTSWILGSTDDYETENHQSGIVLAGGGLDNNDAMKWFLNRANGGDVVVIRASESDGYNNYLYNSLGVNVNSVETILINSRTAAEHPYVEGQIRNAEALFIAGGNQYDYYLYWKDTPVMDAINYLINEKGVVVGGTSAGMAILGKAYYAPNGSGAQSATVLNNPYHSSMNIIGRDDFISIPLLANTITDTHFDQRERSGRLFTFMSRMVTDWEIEAKGIAANEYTAICIDDEGRAYVFGDPEYDDFAYFLKTQNCAPEICINGQKLTWDCNHKAVMVYKLKGKEFEPDYFNMNTWNNESEGNWEYWYAIEGELYKSDATSVSIKKISNIMIYPNPTKDKVWIDAGDHKIEKVFLVNSLGQPVSSNFLDVKNLSTFYLNISHLNLGVYIMIVKTSKEVFFERIILN